MAKSFGKGLRKGRLKDKSRSIDSSSFNKWKEILSSEEIKKILKGYGYLNLRVKPADRMSPGTEGVKKIRKRRKKY